MITRRNLILGAPSLALFPDIAEAQYVPKLEILKSRRLLNLYSGTRLAYQCPIALGRSPVGPKRFHGDMKTPEGQYRISLRNRYSKYHLSLKVNYPSPRDIAFARRNGRSPGGDIFIHGQSDKWKSPRYDDWTYGCIAVSNQHMDALWRYIPTGCPIIIRP